MKLNKKTAIISSFLVGTLLFTTSAFADVLIGNGYLGAKNAVKLTTKKLATQTDSFSADTSFEIKVDGEVCESNHEIALIDIANQKEESTTKSFTKLEGNKEDYYYRDKNTRIYKNNDDDSYYLYNYEKSQVEDENVMFTDPFSEDMAADVEKVADAFVGNMKDFIQSDDTPEGGKVYSGSLESAQIPAFANAISSFAVKYSLLQEYSCERLQIPKINSNIYFKDAQGKISQLPDGTIESGVMTAVVNGEDEKGKTHEIEISLSINIKDVNATTVEKPQLDNEKVVVENTSNPMGIDEKYIGNYSDDIVEVNDGQFVKIGERVLEIASADGEKITGHIYETCGDEPVDLQFEAEKMNKDSDMYCFEYTDASGEKKYGMIEKNYGGDKESWKLLVYLNVKGVKRETGDWSCDSNALEFSRDF